MVNFKTSVPDYIFESSWEVCNKVGGIYTVLSTRAKTLQSLFKDKVIFIGPDLEKNDENPLFIENKTLLKAWVKHARENEQLHVRVGRWNIPGKPITILVDFFPYFTIKEGLYFRMWDKFKVDSISAYGDYDESCVFAYATGLVIKSLHNFLKLEGKNVIAHMNEWMLGMAGLFLRDHVPSIATIFTTHATSIGRSIAGNNKPLYREFLSYDGDQMARELNMEAKHSLEKQAAFYADCFTTVSELTARECKQLLNKSPDIVTPNGFDPDFVPKGIKFDQKRADARKILIEAAAQLIGEKIKNDALLVAIGGRYEYKNKGIDVFIEALNRIRHDNPKKQVIGFILVPAWINGARQDLKNRLQKGKSAKSALYSPYYTHVLNSPENDQVCGYLRYLNFFNQAEYKTKLIFVPSYLHGDDGIFNLSYYDLLIGMDLTIFPSYYEPWGYTPLESIAFSIPTITTNLAGFGLWTKEKGAQSSGFISGVDIVERTEDNYFEVAEDIKESIIRYSKLKPEEVESVREAAKKLSEKASWDNFIRYYLQAYGIALQNAKVRNVNTSLQK